MYLYVFIMIINHFALFKKSEYAAWRLYFTDGLHDMTADDAVLTQRTLYWRKHSSGVKASSDRGSRSSGSFQTLNP